ncbi:hypothetical protein GNX18_07225 [Microbulbifer sp. SH-1]|uniref:intermembrane phospholipid transport protein YdbH family protein n=1 Tax=Microbulbifer sp. SH-1 TaxID=2681547 RepID=UPI00140B3C3A|nr:YdbH domain-containing protein [Microbulbifer sp. SH-1]QIL89570.1 hypothetical protein GNX18_07225 [Microbulbifer sp. SH-1]
MRFVSRSLKIAAIALALLLLAAAAGWMARHSWIPGALNWRLDGMRVTVFQGLSLSRSDRGLGAHLDHLRLVTSRGYFIDVSDIHVSRIPALIRALLSSNTRVLPEAEISVERLAIKSPEPVVDAQENALPKFPPENPASRAPHGADVFAKDTEAATEISVDEVLDNLRNLPIRKLQIQKIQWPQRLNGELSFSATQFPGHTIEGELRSDRCRACRLELKVRIEEALTKSALKLDNGAVTVGQLDTRVYRQGPVNSESPSRRWRLEGSLNLAAGQLPPLFQQVGLSSRERGDWLDLAHSLQGEASLTFKGGIPDRLSNAGDLRDISAAIETRAFSAVLPEGHAGLPVAAEVTTIKPVHLQIHSAVPLSVASIKGELQIRTTIQPASEMPVAVPPLVDSNIVLSTQNGIPQVLFRGETHLDEASRLWNTARWQQVREQIPVTDMRGIQTFTGTFSLPGLNGILSGSDAPKIHQFFAEIRLNDNATFLLEPPSHNNPLAALDWQKLRLTLSGSQAIKLSSAKFPGEMDLEFPQLELAAKDLSKLQDEKQGSPELRGEVGNLRCAGLPAVNCTLQLKMATPQLRLPDTTTSVSNLNLTVAEAHLASGQDGSFSIALKDLNLSADQGHSGEVSIGKPEVFTQQAKCRWQNTAISCSSPHLAINLDPLHSGDNQLRGVVFLEDLLIVHSGDKPGDFQAAASFHADNLNVSILKQYKAGFSARGKWQIANQEITGSSDISGGPLALVTKWQHSLKSGQGTLMLALPQVEFTPTNPLSRAVSGLPVDIVGGKLQADARIHWPESGKSQFQLGFIDTAFQYNDSFAVGVNTEIALQQNDGNWVTIKPVPVSVKSVDTGIAVTNVNFLLSLAENGDLTLRNISAELLEGALTAENLYWNLSGEERHSHLQFTGLSLGALAKEMESTNFAASGLIDASIPITTDRQGVTVDNGTVQSRPPGGRLRYYGAFSPGMLGSNPQLKLLAGALEDYNYRDISGTMSYPLSGDLQLNLKLTGRSAAIDANRDLIINLNLENNIPSMLRSLQASRDVTDVLERQVQ